ncbi:hypothetical protein JZU61_06120 [bacterium]|nr:hypothetical protein [bacterium]
MLRNEIIEDDYIEVIIPNDLIQQAHLENILLEFEITDEGLLIKPIIQELQ